MIKCDKISVQNQKSNGLLQDQNKQGLYLFDFYEYFLVARYARQVISDK